MYSFTCFGEVLWDVFPTHEKIGGAPLNVAFRLKSFKNKVSIISSVGNDILGEKLIQYLQDNSIDAGHIQISDGFQTGKVNVDLDDSGSATYEIEFPAAWDHIQLTKESIKLVEKSRVFVYGSLAGRNSVSKNTLLQLLKVAPFKVFDVNLRPPHFSQELLNELMAEADFIKFNEEELELITKKMGSKASTNEENMSFIANTFNADYVCVTRGGQGAVLLIRGKFYFNSGYDIVVKDTVGAGDSFLATLIYKLTSDVEPQVAIDNACAIGALVAGCEGANPAILDTDVIDIMS